MAIIIAAHAGTGKTYAAKMNVLGMNYNGIMQITKKGDKRNEKTK